MAKHGQPQSLTRPARRPERVRETSRLQRALHALGLDAHVDAPAGPDPVHVRDNDAIRTSHEPDELVLGTALPAPQTRANRDMRHAPAVGGSASEAAGASASAAGSARAASHSSAAA